MWTLRLQPDTGFPVSTPCASQSASAKSRLAESVRLLSLARKVEGAARRDLYWQIVHLNRGIVRKLAWSLRTESMEDDRQEALLALYDAVERWEPERGGLFKLARWALLVRKRASAPRLGIHIGRLTYERIVQMRSIYVERSLRGLPVDLSTLARLVGVSTVADPEAIAVAWWALGIQDEADERSGLYDDDAVPVLAIEPHVPDWMGLARLGSARDRLGIRDNAVLDARFSDAEPSLEEVGDFMGRSGERVRQIEAEAIRRLREAFLPSPAVKEAAPDRGMASVVRRCANCRQSGHNVSTCKNATRLIEPTLVSPVAPAMVRPVWKRSERPVVPVPAPVVKPAVLPPVCCWPSCSSNRLFSRGYCPLHVGCLEVLYPKVKMAALSKKQLAAAPELWRAQEEERAKAHERSVASAVLAGAGMARASVAVASAAMREESSRRNARLPPPPIWRSPRCSWPLCTSVRLLSRGYCSRHVECLQAVYPKTRVGSLSEQQLVAAPEQWKKLKEEEKRRADRHGQPHMVIVSSARSRSKVRTCLWPSCTALHGISRGYCARDAQRLGKLYPEVTVSCLSAEQLAAAPALWKEREERRLAEMRERMRQQERQDRQDR